MFCTSTAVTPSSIVAAEEVMEQEGETHTPSSSRCPSRQSNRSVGGDTNSEEDDEIHIPAKKSKEEHHKRKMQQEAMAFQQRME